MLAVAEAVAPVVAQRQIRMNRKVQKTMVIHQLQNTDDVVGVPVVSVVQAPLVRVVMKTVETHRSAAETTEIPQLPLVEKIVMTPKIQKIQGSQTSESLSVDSRGLSHQDCEVLFHVNKQSPDIAGGVHVDRDDLRVMLAAQGTQASHQQATATSRADRRRREGKRRRRGKGRGREGKEKW